ncbi:4Fe-4S binding protein [Peptococcus simiae]|uniref:4Fe-4S binding protein n=1 Tax=Peptococcus simiae TaxID=1643805 RepID=UPI00397F5796
MAHVINGDCCISCGACEGECPVSAISANDDGIRVVDADACIDCGSCAAACPSDCIAAE